MEIISKQKDTAIGDGDVWLVKSKHVEDTFRVIITPSRGNVPDGKRFGVVLATDAELSAGGLISTIRSCSVGFDLPFLFGVSIGYPLNANPPFALRRNRDLTPTSWDAFEKATPVLTGLSDHVATGHSDAFSEFIHDELLPKLADEFPIEPQDSTLTGQSFGGLFVLNELLNRPGRFRRYLAVSPSLWWDDGALLKSAPQLVKSAASPTADLYMCVGELENKARFRAQISQLPEAMKSLLPSAMTQLDMAGDMFLMEKELGDWVGNTFSVEAHVFPEESHESMMGSAFSRGLRKLYKPKRV